MTIPIPAVLVPSARPNGLLSVLNPLPSGWERGVDVLINSVLSPVCFGPCSGQAGEPERPGEVVRFVPAQISQYVYCSTLGRPDMRETAEAANRTSIGYALSSVLVTGSCTENPQLQDGTDVGDAATAIEAICAVEAALEPLLHGRLGVIHVPVGHSCNLVDAVYQDTYNGRRVLRTWAGNLVAVHGTGDRVYGTGELWGDWTVVDTQEYVDRSVNNVEARADILGMVVFDPAVNVYVDITGS